MCDDDHGLWGCGSCISYNEMYKYTLYNDINRTGIATMESVLSSPTRTLVAKPQFLERMGRRQ